MKGMMYTIEAVIGAILVLIGITFIFPAQQQKELNLLETSFNCLIYLDQRGLLRYYAENNMNNELKDSLKSCLPPILDFKFKICSTSNCIETTIPYDKEVYLSSYLIAGENTYNKKLINLWVWLK
ncbi:MAG: hypothetical protein QXK49_03025 [Candidatus Aenigmatarchaeota archaeon]